MESNKKKIILRLVADVVCIACSRYTISFVLRTNLKMPHSSLFFSISMHNYIGRS